MTVLYFDIEMHIILLLAIWITMNNICWINGECLHNEPVWSEVSWSLMFLQDTAFSSADGDPDDDLAEILRRNVRYRSQGYIELYIQPSSFAQASDRHWASQLDEGKSSALYYHGYWFLVVPAICSSNLDQSLCLNKLIPCRGAALTEAWNDEVRSTL